MKWKDLNLVHEALTDFGDSPYRAASCIVSYSALVEMAGRRKDAVQLRRLAAAIHQMKEINYEHKQTAAR